MTGSDTGITPNMNREVLSIGELALDLLCEVVSEGRCAIKEGGTPARNRTLLCGFGDRCIATECFGDVGKGGSELGNDARSRSEGQGSEPAGSDGEHDQAASCRGEASSRPDQSILMRAARAASLK